MTTDDNWQPCQPGTIQEIAQQQQHSERRETMTRRAVFSTVLLAGAGITYSLLNRNAAQPGQQLAALNCRQTLALAEQYLSGQLDAQQVVLVDAHLAKCGKCADHIASLSQSAQA